MPAVGLAQETKDRDGTPESINEQTIYVPYEKLREVFERDGRGVFLPYDKFQKLWSQARKNQPCCTPATHRDRPAIRPASGQFDHVSDNGFEQFAIHTIDKQVRRQHVRALKAISDAD